jgi:hypothetical protein
MAFFQSPATIIYGETSTRTLSTTLTTQKSQPLVTTLYPSPVFTQPLQYTTLSTSILPILILTEVIRVVLKSTPINTGTLLQPWPSEPTRYPILGAEFPVEESKELYCSQFRCWTHSQQAGTVIGIVFISLLIIGVMWWGLGRRSRSTSRRGRRSRRDEEDDRWRKRRGPLGAFLEGMGCLSRKEERSRSRQRRRRSISSSLSSILRYELSDRGRRSAYPPMALSTVTAPSRGWDSPTAMSFSRGRPRSLTSPLPAYFRRRRSRSRTPPSRVRRLDPDFFMSTRRRTLSPRPRYFIRRRPRTPTPPPIIFPPPIFYAKPPPSPRERSPPTIRVPYPIRVPVPVPVPVPGPRFYPRPRRRLQSPSDKRRRQINNFAVAMVNGQKFSPPGPPPQIPDNLNVAVAVAAKAGSPAVSPGVSPAKRRFNNAVAAAMVKPVAKLAAKPAAIVKKNMPGGVPLNQGRQPPAPNPPAMKYVVRAPVKALPAAKKNAAGGAAGRAPVPVLNVKPR